jgi:hypothetical protein
MAPNAKVLGMGSRGFFGGGVLLCAAAALLVTPAGAGAKPGYEVTPRAHLAELTLKGTHGYEISLFERDRRSLSVDVSKLEGSIFAPLVAAEYLIHQHKMRGDGIAGTLPGLGRVSVRFHPVGVPQREEGFSLPGCRGGGLVKQPGYFKGTIRFHGERVYTTAHATRAHGEVTTREREVCKRSPKHLPEGMLPMGLITARLRAISKSGGRLVRFSVGSFEPLTPKLRDADVDASIDERRKGMRISRYIIASGRHVLRPGDSSDFPASATIAPPAPFHGSAVFERGSRGQISWTGSLSVPLPGAGLVPLTGRNFSASLCQEGGCTQW